MPIKVHKKYRSGKRANSGDGQGYWVGKKYIHRRVEEPSKFQKGSFRTIDPGRKGHTKLIIGRKRGKSTTSTQAILEER